MEDADPASPEELCRANERLRSPARRTAGEGAAAARARATRNARRGWPASIGRTCGGLYELSNETVPAIHKRFGLYGTTSPRGGSRKDGRRARRSPNPESCRAAFRPEPTPFN